MISLEEDIEDMLTSFLDAIKEINVLSDQIKFKKILIAWQVQWIEDDKFNWDKHMPSKIFLTLEINCQAGGDLV